MSTAGILVALALLAVTLAVIVAPILRRWRDVTGDATLEMRRERLLVYYERVLTNIRDLDEDLATGKITGTDYVDEREDWVLRGIQVLKALDALETAAAPVTTAPIPDAATIDRDIDAAIEAAIAAYRKHEGRP